MKGFPVACFPTDSIPALNRARFEFTIQKVTKAQKYVGGRKSAAKSVEKRDRLNEDLATLKKYKKILDATMSTDLSLRYDFKHQSKHTAVLPLHTSVNES